MKQATIFLGTFILFNVLVLPIPIIHSQQTPCSYRVYFSPRGGCTEAIINELKNAKTSVLVQVYYFTSVPVAKVWLPRHMASSSDRSEF